MDSSASIRPADILTVRECGNSLVETFRQRALKVSCAACRRAAGACTTPHLNRGQRQELSVFPSKYTEAMQPASLYTEGIAAHTHTSPFHLCVAMQGDDTWMQRLEQEQVAGAKGAAGMEPRQAG